MVPHCRQATYLNATKFISTTYQLAADPDPRLGHYNGHMPVSLSAANPRKWLLICSVIVLIWFVGLDWRPLLTPDEGRYAEIGREMAASGDFITPRLNGLSYFEKPPLHYWLTALAFKAFGVSDWVVRLISALYGFGAALLAYVALLRLRDRTSAQLAFLISIGCCWIAAMGHFVALDIGLNFWLTMTLCGLIGCVERLDAQALTQRADAIGGWPDYWVWFGLSGAFLSKGLIGLVVPAAAMFLTIVVTRRLSLITAVRWWPGVFLFTALVLPWLILISSRNPGVLEFFFIHEHFARFTSQVHRRVEPWWYFVPVFLLGGLPWLGHWLAVWRNRVRSSADTVLLTWCAFLFVFFSASGSKLPSYILPMFPALAIWLARQQRALSPVALRYASLPMLLAGLLLCAALLPLMQEADRDETGSLASGYLPWAVGACVALILGAIASWCSVKGQHSRGALSAIAPLAVAMLLTVQFLQWGHSSLGERFSARALVQRWLAQEPTMRADTPIFSVGTYDQTIPFYLARTVTLVDYRDEMDMGLKIEPHKYGGSSQELLQRWPSLPLAYAVLDLGGIEQWRAAGVPFREVTRNGRRVVVANR